MWNLLGLGGATECPSAETAKPDEAKPDEAKPVEEAKPADVAEPDEDAKPAEVAAPVQAAKPAEVAEPADEPMEEAKPVEQIKPADDVKPAEDAKPTKDAKPTEEATPVEEAKPAEETATAQETKPAKPAAEKKPAEEAKPADEAIGLGTEALQMLGSCSSEKTEPVEEAKVEERKPMEEVKPVKELGEIEPAEEAKPVVEEAAPVEEAEPVPVEERKPVELEPVVMPVVDKAEAKPAEEVLPPPEEVVVCFTLGHAETDLGETIRIVGGTAELGDWDPAQGLLLETAEGMYPKWSATVTISTKGASATSALEYKYVRDKRCCDGDFCWENSVRNRSIKIKAAMNGKHLEVFDDAYDYDVPSTVVLHSKSGASESKEADEDSTVQDSSENDGSTSDTSDERGPHLNNVPSRELSQVGECMHRLASLSALDQLIDDPEEMVKLREELDALNENDDRPVRYGARHLETPIVVVSSECHPWSKTGGLAMVASSYGYEFAMRGHRTMVVSPMYGFVENCVWAGSANIWLCGGEHQVQFWVQHQKYGQGRACDYVFVEHHCYKRAEGIYGPPGGEYSDNLFRFSLLSLAALEAPLVLELNGKTYGQEVLFIANDWQTGLVPVYLAHKYQKNQTYMNARSMMVIHNIGYQGKYTKTDHPIDSFLGLPAEAQDDLQGEDLNMGTNCHNLLSAGIKVADRVLTVSPNYANEIQSPEGGCGLYDILKWKAGCLRLAGILNGISDEWNPRTDKNIPRNYSIKDYKEGKAECKAALQKELGLHEDPGACLIGFCGRLCYQKGLPLILGNIQWMMNGQGAGRVQLIIMGKGEPEYQSRVAQMESGYKGRLCGYVGFDPTVEHRMMAGCDVLLMPSQYEPCGLPQMYAQAYGTLPVVHETGGLKDSVKGLWEDERDRHTATGFLFCGFDEHEMRGKIHKALELYHHRRPVFNQMQENAMREDFYWPRMMDQYEQHVDWTMENNRFR